MRHLLILSLVFLFFSFFNTKVFAVYDPTKIANNKYGIHILFPSEISEAAHLVNSSGGDWGYVTIPIQANDRNLDKWQSFMNDCAKYHLIPIVRIATVGDYFSKSSWSKPDDYDIIDFANFLNDLTWPTKNRYVVIFNEPNRGDEWGGTPNPSEYAQILSFAVDVFKQRSNDFFIISAGLDNAAANSNNYYSNFTFIRDMQLSNPQVFSKIDGLASHSYPNPGFSAPPSVRREGIYSYYYEQSLISGYTGKVLPVFITETGWTSDKISQEQQAQYYIQSFTSYWNDPNVIAVTPFIFNASEGPFMQFSFITSGTKNKIYYSFYNLPKNKGQPKINPILKINSIKDEKLPTERFKSQSLENIFKRVTNNQKTFFKWVLGI